MATVIGPDVDVYLTIDEWPRWGVWDIFHLGARLVPTGGWTPGNARANDLNGYQLFCYDNFSTDGGGNHQIFAFIGTIDDDHALFGTVLTAGVVVSVINGDALGLRCYGSQITSYHRTGGVWSVLETVTDATYSAAGYVSWYLPGNIQDEDNTDPGYYINFGAGPNTGGTFPEAPIVDTFTRADATTLGLHWESFVGFGFTFIPPDSASISGNRATNTYFTESSQDWYGYAWREQVSARNLLTGQGHTVTGSDNVIIGQQGTVEGDRIFLASMDGAPHTINTSNTVAVYADNIILNGTSIGSGGVELDNLSDVTITSPATDDMLTYDGAEWVNDPHRLRRTSVTLTNAQIKALPGTPFTLVANQGSNKIVNWVRVDLFAKFAAGAYSGVDTGAAYLFVGASGGVQASTNIANYTGDSPDYTLSALTTFFGAANTRARMLPYLQTPVIDSTPTNVSDSGWVIPTNEDGTFGLDASADLDDTGIALVFDNNGSSSDLTGGHASNSLKVVVYWSLEDLP